MESALAVVSLKKQVGSIAAVETFYFRFISVSDFIENENVCKLTIEISNDIFHKYSLTTFNSENFINKYVS